MGEYGNMAPVSAAELEKRRRRVGIIIPILKKLFPGAKIALRYRNNWQLLVAIILSAQCTDKKVNEVTPALFKKYPRLEDYLRADPREFEKDIRPTGFYRNKTKSILGAAWVIKERFHGNVPRTMEEMLAIPGVARKTANVVLGNAYGIVEGIAVDTHVRRLAKLLGLTNEDNPEKIERDLMAAVPRKYWFPLTYWFIEYGRKYCPARSHAHERCPLSGIAKRI